MTQATYMPRADGSVRIVVNNAQCRVCHVKFNAQGHYDEQRLRTVGICTDCDFWVEKWQLRNNENVARIGGQHYMFGNHLQDYIVDANDSLADIVDKWNVQKKAGLGMGGDKLVIKFNDGRIIVTNDLWHQGTIPARFANVMPDNAEMVRL